MTPKKPFPPKKSSSKKPSSSKKSSSKKLSSSSSSQEITLPESSDFKKVGDELIHDGYFFRTVIASFSSPEGKRFDRDMVYHPGAVAVVAVQDNKVVLLHQYRAPLDKVICEIPAGRCDVEGEPPEDTAKRELIEEAGLTCESLTKLGVFYNSPGFSDEITHIFLASGLQPAAQIPDGPEEEWMTMEMKDLSEVPEMIARSEISDAKTVIGLLLAIQCLNNPPPPG